MTPEEIRDDRLFNEKVKLIGKGLVSVNGYLSKQELVQCIELLKDPVRVFISEVESLTPMRVRLKIEDGKEHFQFHIEQPKYTGFRADYTTITDVITLEQAKAFFKGYLAFSKVQSKINQQV